MATAAGNRVQMAYVPETVFGTTPATPQMILIPMHSTTLDLTKQIISDPTIVSDRMKRFERHGNKQVGGNLVASLQHAQWDDFIEAALGGTWTTNVCKVGSTVRSFTIEEGFLDIAQYRRFTGVRVNSWEVSISPNAIVTSTFALIGKDVTTSTSPLDASPTAVLNKAPLVHNGMTITVGGSAVTATACSFSVTNNANANFAIGSSSALDITSQESTVSGSITFYFENMTAYNRFVNETSAAISLTLTEGSDTVTISIPNAKFNGASIPVSGPGVVFVTQPFVALYDNTAATTISVTRS
jgi:hypothetical protein